MSAFVDGPSKNTNGEEGKHDSPTKKRRGKTHNRIPHVLIASGRGVAEVSAGSQEQGNGGSDKTTTYMSDHSSRRLSRRSEIVRRAGGFSESPPQPPSVQSGSSVSSSKSPLSSADLSSYSSRIGHSRSPSNRRSRSNEEIPNSYSPQGYSTLKFAVPGRMFGNHTERLGECNPMVNTVRSLTD